MILKKKSNWICSCGRKNGFDDLSCGFCKRPHEQKEKSEKPAKERKPIKKKTAYDEIKLWPVFSKYIRLRDSNDSGVGKCFTCQRLIDWKNADCGHGVPRQYKATKYNECNNHLQCKHCNGFNGGVREVYKVEMDRRYGSGTWDKMILASRQQASIGKVEVDVMALHYSREIERLLREKSK